ncbi:hypothetical protein I7I48_01599 [Histoplasma ohiense]|nr:hypothetical protein I7I48_01599 [Histoplasma ohiense (nom. inval.)]
MTHVYHASGVAKACCVCSLRRICCSKSSLTLHRVRSTYRLDRRRSCITIWLTLSVKIQQRFSWGKHIALLLVFPSCFDLSLLSFLSFWGSS